MTCVECLVNKDCKTAPLLVCSAQRTCVECQMDDDCPSKLCLTGRTCALPEDVTYVGGTGAMDNPMCTVDKPCQNLTQGLRDGALRKYIKVTGAITDDAETTIMDKQVTIYGRSGGKLARSPSSGEVLVIKGMMNPEVTLYDLEIICNGGSANKNCVEIGDKATVTMIGVNLHNHGQAGIAMSGTKLVLEKSQVHDNVLEGVKVAAGILEIRGSSIYGNKGLAGVFTMTTSMVTIDSTVIAANTGPAGASISGPFTIVNSIIARNGNATASTGGLILMATNGVVDFSTIAKNVSDSGGNAGVTCTGTVGISNSILTDNNSLVPISPGCTNITYSLTSTSPPALPGNMMGAPMFINDIDPLNPNYFRIMSASDARGKANSNAPITVDIDNQPRDDGMKDMGADEYK